MLLALALACASTPSPPTGGATAPAEAPTEAPAEAPEAPPEAAAPEALTQADRDMGLLARCPDGRLAFGFWAGEYPSPVVQIDRPTSATVADQPCGAAQRACTVPAGLLHPWATEADAVPGVSFATLRAVDRYAVQQAHDLGGVAVQPGDEVVVLTYLSEGFCRVAVGGQALEAECPSNGGAAEQRYRAVGGPSPDPVQRVRVPCAEGAPGWLTIDPAWMARPEVRDGELRGYGEVGKAP